MPAAAKKPAKKQRAASPPAAAAKRKRRTRPGATSAAQIAAQQRQQKALELRLQGYQFDEIAAELKYAGHSGARKAVLSALDRSLREPAAELRKLEELRLDRLLKAIAARLEKGDLYAIDRAIAIARRRARLHGLDAPTKQEHTGAGGEPLIPPVPVEPWAPDKSFVADVLRILKDAGQLPEELAPDAAADVVAPTEQVPPAGSEDRGPVPT